MSSLYHRASHRLFFFFPLSAKCHQISFQVHTSSTESVRVCTCVSEANVTLAVFVFIDSKVKY